MQPYSRSDYPHLKNPVNDTERTISDFCEMKNFDDLERIIKNPHFAKLLPSLIYRNFWGEIYNIRDQNSKTNKNCHNNFLDLICKNIEKNPELGIVQLLEGDSPSLMFKSILKLEDSEQKTKLLKYLLLLGVKIPDAQFDKREELIALKKSMREDLIKALDLFKIRGQEPF